MGTTELAVLVSGAITVTATGAAATSVLLARRRCRLRMAATLSWISALQVSPDTLSARRTGTGDAPEEETTEPLQVRILRAQVRSLEEALDGEQRGAGRAATDDALDTYRRRVVSTIGAIGRQVEDDANAVHVLDRVAAAVDRLSAEPRFARPVLASGPAVLDAYSVLPRAVQRPAAATRQDEPAPAPAAETTAPAPVPVPATEAETVLPVPPLPAETSAQRSRRRFRRAA